jgi:O-antigen/teichoic acid export membrane protein
MREFAIAFEGRDLNLMAALFRRYIPMFYAIAAYLSCFILVQADKVVYFVGGEKFSGAVVPLMVMALYPMFQTYGQLSGSVFYATGQTALYRNIGVIILILGVPVTYFLIAPHAALGLDAGATGLSIKMVLVQVLGVNVMLYYNAKVLNLPFWRYLGHQVLSLAGLLAIAFIAKLMVAMSMPVNKYVVVQFLVAGMVYTVIVIVAFVIKPDFFGLNREDIVMVFNKMRGKLIN